MDGETRVRPKYVPPASSFDFAEYVRNHIEWSTKTFGPGDRTEGVIKHIKKELEEVAKEPTDVMEWCDIIILAIDGAQRNGHSPEAIADALWEKQGINMKRKWPDWRTMPVGAPIEHVRHHDDPRLEKTALDEYLEMKP